MQGAERILLPFYVCIRILITLKQLVDGQLSNLLGFYVDIQVSINFNDKLSFVPVCSGTGLTLRVLNATSMRKVYLAKVPLEGCMAVRCLVVQDRTLVKFSSILLIFHRLGSIMR